MERPDALIITAHGTSAGSPDPFMKAMEIARELYPEADIRLSLAASGASLHSRPLEPLFQDLAGEGCRRVALFPLYVHDGKGYRDAFSHAEAARSLFDRINVGKPLIHDQESSRDVAAHLLSEYGSDEAVCFMGHGSPDSDNASYHQLARELSVVNTRAFLFVMEGEPSLETTLNMMKEQGIVKIILAPLLMVKGSHVIRDMGGVYRERFEKEGISVVIDETVLLDREGIVRYMFTSAGVF